MVRAELLKSRSNKAGQSCNLVYNQSSGFDPIMTLFQFASDANLVDGRNPYKYFKSNKDIKFDSRKFRQACIENEAVKNELFDSTRPYLNKLLSSIDED